ncbi:thymidylate synthase [Silvibacterium acidisoli]|uniref:thymidylate synthase n=1 Tax=Acidobacteriaceae bacterium ZG23-2 TaxID=2883246 RepID=UPI00406C0DD4
MSAPFAIVEVIGIVAGRQDSAYLNFFNPRLPKFAGAGVSYPGAYGYRLRNHFGVDQLERACSALARNPHSRQAVLQIWDANTDIPLADGSPTSADVPCNLCSMLKLRNGKLYWTQVMRSNDLFRGTPYNFVQFTMLQELLAGWLGVAMGSYTQLSDSLHVYERDLENVTSRIPLDAPTSEDNLLLPKDMSDSIWSSLNKAVNELIAPGLRENDIVDIAVSPGTPAVRNMLLIVAADSARRRGYDQLANDLSGRCTNPLLSLASKRWHERTSYRKLDNR